MNELLKVIVNDARAGLAELPEKSCQACVTSPPYWGLRQYLFDKATVLRHDLTNEEKTYVESELKKHGVAPRRSW